MYLGNLPIPTVHGRYLQKVQNQSTACNGDKMSVRGVVICNLPYIMTISITHFYLLDFPFSKGDLSSQSNSLRISKTAYTKMKFFPPDDWLGKEIVFPDDPGVIWVLDEKLSETSRQLTQKACAEFKRSSIAWAVFSCHRQDGMEGKHAMKIYMQ